MSIESTRRQTILTTLSTGPASAQTLASIVGAPQASVRRTIAMLRDMGRSGGFVINDARDNNGLYRLVQG